MVYVGWKAAARRTRRCLQTVAGHPLIWHIVQRLRRGLSCAITVVHHEDAVAGQLREALTGVEVRLFAATAWHMSAALEEMAVHRRWVGHLAIFGETAPFPDCQSARRMVEDHCRRDADCTVAAAHATGLLPILVHTRALELLAPCNAMRPEWAFDPFVRAADLLGSRAGAPDARPGRTVSTFTDPDLAAARLPDRVVVSDGRTRDAAEAVMAGPTADCGDAVAAALFKEQWTQALVRRVPVASSAAARPGIRRVLIVSARDAFGGGEVSLYELIRHLGATRYEPVLLVQFESVLAEKARALGVRVHVADFNLVALGPQTVQFFRDLLDAERIDVVHLDNHVPAALSPALALAASDRGLPIVAHARLRRLPGMPLPEIAHHYDRVVAPSQYIAESLATTLLPVERITQIYDGVDLRALDPARYDRAALRAAFGIPADAQVITMVAAINDQKRQDLLIRAVARLKRDHAGATALLVGEPDNVELPYLQRLQRLIRELGLEAATIFLGFEPEVARVYAVSDVVVMCMPDEGWGRSTVEAMAMGVPVVVPRSGGAQEIVSDEGGGLLFEPGDVDDLERQLRAAFDSAALRRELAAAGRRSASRYSCEAHAQAMAALFDQLLSGVGRGRIPVFEPRLSLWP